MNLNQIISVTGTKGKTTVVTMISQALQKLGVDTLHVDTTGHFVNGERRSTLDDSKKSWRLVPSVCPGRFLWEFRDHPALKDNPKATSVLECSVGCRSYSGLGYRAHDIGIFLNVFEDHLGSSERLKTRRDIAVAKNFIFNRITRDGYAIFNADDELVVEQLPIVPEHLNISLIACGLNFAAFDIKKHLAAGGKAITVNKAQQVVLRTNESDTVLCELTQVPWTFEGQYTPSIYNLLFIAAGVCARLGFEQLGTVRPALESLRLDPYGGRLTVLKATNGATVIADYAHEKTSLKVIGQLAKGMTEQGQVIGVVRLAHDRTDQLLTETGHVIGEAFDRLVVYDKIDGHFKKPQKVRSQRFPQITGRTSQILADAIAERNPAVERIIREDEAVARAAELAGPNDVVVVIVNDNIERSIGFIQSSFKAEFI